MKRISALAWRMPRSASAGFFPQLNVRASVRWCEVILLFDQNLSFRLVSILADVFPGAKHVRVLALTQSNDQEIWNVAKKNGFIVVS